MITRRDLQPVLIIYAPFKQVSIDFGDTRLPVCTNANYDISLSELFIYAGWITVDIDRGDILCRGKQILFDRCMLKGHSTP